MAVSIFLMIGIWYMSDSSVSAKRIVQMYYQIWFCGVFITVMLLLFNHPVSKSGILRVIFPFFLRSVWFGTAYISLMLLYPFLSKIFSLGEIFVRKLLIILSIISIPFITVFGFDDTWLNVVFWFAYMYLMVKYYKMYIHTRVSWNRYFVGCLGGVLYILLAIGKMICFNHKDVSLFSYGYDVLYLWIIDYKQIPNLLCAFCIFYFFITGKPGENRLINLCARGTFSIYIIHQIPTMESYLWNGILKCSQWCGSKWYSLYILMSITAVGVIGIIIDVIRRKWMEPLWSNSCVALLMEKKIDCLINIEFLRRDKAWN